jgi:hypothetical protein
MTRRCSIVLGMAANFGEVAACSGVDENLPTGAQGIVVPSGGSTLVILEDARGLDVRSTMPSKVYVYEFKAKQERAVPTRNASNASEAMRRFEMVLGVSSGSRLTLRLDLTQSHRPR